MSASSSCNTARNGCEMSACALASRLCHTPCTSCTTPPVCLQLHEHLQTDLARLWRTQRTSLTPDLRPPAMRSEAERAGGARRGEQERTSREREDTRADRFSAASRRACNRCAFCAPALIKGVLSSSADSASSFRSPRPRIASADPTSAGCLPARAAAPKSCCNSARLQGVVVACSCCTHALAQVNTCCLRVGLQRRRQAQQGTHTAAASVAALALVAPHLPSARHGHITRARTMRATKSAAQEPHTHRRVQPQGVAHRVS